MIKSKMFAASGVAFASLVLVLGLLGWMRSVSPIRVAQAAGLIDDTASDFSDGAGCFVLATGASGSEGEVTAFLETDFPGTALPLEWFIANAGTATVSDGQLIANDIRTGPLPVGPGPSDFYAPGRVLEFNATFTQTADQHIGFGQFLQAGTEQWAIFSTRSDGAQLWARTNDGTSETLTPLGTGYFSQTQLYRIEWGTSVVTYSINGVGVATHTVSIAATMRPQIMDSNDTNHALVVDGLRMTTMVPTPCTFTSRTINSAYTGFSFTGISSTLSLPAGTGVTFEARVSADGFNWGAWVPVNADGTFSAGLGQYLQYSATLSTADALVTPAVLTIQAHGLTPTAVNITSFAAIGSDFGTRGLLIGVSVAGLVIGGLSVIFRRRRMIR
ncbi:MAG: hypothetical protein KA765_15940 [Thermoflexales bacterium]|nr:hypothetical protein [Thermoflexales bacterium]